MKLLIILLILMISCGKKDNAGVIQTVNNMASDQVIITDNDPTANRFGIKNSAHNIINIEERINAQVALIEGDNIKIILTGSNKKDLLPLKVLAKFSQK
jgi:hypothetical protein